jgi:hypothetical protein
VSEIFSVPPLDRSRLFDRRLSRLNQLKKQEKSVTRREPGLPYDAMQQKRLTWRLPIHKVGITLQN